MSNKSSRYPIDNCSNCIFLNIVKSYYYKKEGEYMFECGFLDYLYYETKPSYHICDHYQSDRSLKRENILNDIID